jgi:hypothetical protein
LAFQHKFRIEEQMGSSLAELKHEPKPEITPIPLMQLALHSGDSKPCPQQ